MKLRVHILFIFIALVFAIPFTHLNAEIIKSGYDTFFPQKAQVITVDKGGIPIIDYGYNNGVYVGKQKNPVQISQTALFYYGSFGQNDNFTQNILHSCDSYDYIESDINSTTAFLNCADYLVNSSVSHGNYSVWEYTFSWPFYNLSEPWISGMAQGVGIQVLSRAYSLTGNKKYLDVANSSLEAFYVDIDKGGVTYKEDDGWFYEEYAQANNSIKPKVLNGFLFSLIAINDFYEQTGDKKAKYLFDMGLKSLKSQLINYDTGSWTYYDNKGNLASEKYHHIHLKQLKKIYEITGDPFYMSYIVKWEGYEKKPLTILQIGTDDNKIFIGNTLLIFIILECFWIFRRRDK